MSDAQVQFHRLDNADAEPGQEQTFSFRCPRGRPGHNRRCGVLIISGRTDVKRDGQNRNGGRAQWDWNGDREAPTFVPSINCQGCWHGYIRDGRCVDTGGRDEPERCVRPERW